MIHDFATLSKSNPAEELRPQRKQAEIALPFSLKQKQLLLLVALAGLALISTGFYLRVWSSDSAATEFSPGVTETKQYQKESLFPGIAFEPDNILDGVTSLELAVAPNSDLLEPLLPNNEIKEQAAFDAAVNGEHVAESGFGFYDSLQASPWNVPVQRGVYLTEEDLKRANYTYILQAASMRNYNDALALVRKLKEMGMNATFTKSGGSFGDTWYRINVGPFTDVSVMNKAEDRLVAMKMMPLKRRIK